MAPNPSPSGDHITPINTVGFLKRVISESIVGQRKRQRVLHEQCMAGTSTPASPLSVESTKLDRPFLGAISSLAQFLVEDSCLPSVVSLIAELMKENGSNWNIQYNGIRLLTESGGPKILGAVQYVERLILGMKFHANEPLLQIEALCGLLHWMRLDEQVLRAIGNSSCMSTIMDTLAVHSNILHLRRLVLDILRTLICSTVVPLETIVSTASVVPSLMHLLEENIDDLGTQQVGLSILSWIIEEKNSREVISREGGVETILDIMRMHPQDEICQCNGAATLCWLIHTTSFDGLSGFDYEDFRVIVDTMRRFLDNPMVFGNSVCVLCGALMNDIQRDEESRFELVKLALIGMKIHKLSPKVHRNGLTLLRFLSTDVIPEIHTLILSELIIIDQAMRLHPDDSAIQVEACTVLANIAISDAARDAISESPCIEAAAQCQVRHNSNIRVQHAALLFHSRLLEGTQTESHSAFGGDLQVLATMTAGILLPDAIVD